MQEAFETKPNGVYVRKYLSEGILRGKKVRMV
jgi:hypothetical protein